jgi:hypothetical protein
MKKLFFGLLALGALSVAHAECEIQVGLTSNLGKEFELAEKILAKKGYIFTEDAPLSLFFTADATEYNSYYKIMSHETNVTIIKFVNNLPVRVFEGEGTEIGSRLNKNPWRRSVKEALANLPNCSQD